MHHNGQEFAFCPFYVDTCIIAIVDETSHLNRFGLHPAAEQLEEVRRILMAETAQETRSQGAGNTLLMHLCCVQLFNQGCLKDVLRIWRAKRASMDAYASIEVQLLCGQGLAQTKAYLAAVPGPEASAALTRIEAGEREPFADFEAFSPKAQTAEYERYYGVESKPTAPDTVDS